jgi:coenzyme F420-reducing hydrogenase gamma subunit
MKHARPFEQAGELPDDDPADLLTGDEPCRGCGSIDCSCTCPEFAAWVDGQWAIYETIQAEIRDGRAI